MSSVGQALGGAVGAVAGFFIGGPSGAYYGAQIGMTIGGIIDPPKGPKIQGPRLNDLSVQTSTYGAFIPRVYGTIALNGNVFWLENNKLKEVEKKEDQGGKGGPPASEVTTWSYYATFAVGLCEGPIIGVRRIWVGSKLIYDAGSADIPTLAASNEAAELFTLHLGSDTQVSDTRMQSTLGVANTPAYRGLAYMVFNDYPLADHGNSLAAAQVKVEVVASGSLGNIFSVQGTVTTQQDNTDVIADNNFAYSIGSQANTLQVVNISDPAKPSIHGASLAMEDSPWSMTKQGNIVYIVAVKSANQVGGSLYIFDVSNPAAPLRISRTVTAASVKYVAISTDGDYAYVVNNGQDNDGTARLQIYSVTSIAAPVLVGSVNTGGNPGHIAVYGIYAYVVSIAASTMEVFNVSNPAAPVLVGSVAVSTGPRTIVIQGIHAYVITSGGLLMHVFDLSTPTAPVQIGSVAIASLAI